MHCYPLRMRSQLALIAGALVLGGCASSMPKNAEEFRQLTAERARVIGWMPGVLPTETFEVERPFREVSSTLQKKANECLKVAIQWATNRGSGVDTYKPTFVAGPAKAELHVQLRRGAVIEVGAPPDGAYRVVLDATPVAARRTRIDMYTMSIDDNLLRRALRGWALGDNLGCPDLTKR